LLVLIGMSISFGYLRLSGTKLDFAKNPEPGAIERTIVTDASLLKATNPAFYQDAIDGDWVLRYETHLDLYRPSDSRVIQRASLVK